MPSETFKLSPSAERVLIMGAAGRDFHTFNLCFRDNPAFRVVAFTAAQIPGIENRRYPSSLSGQLYPAGIPIYAEESLEELVVKQRIHQVIFAYSDVSHLNVMHLASRVLACGADFRLIGPERSFIAARRPVISVCAVRTGCDKGSVVRRITDILRDKQYHPVVVRHPMPCGDLEQQAAQLRDLATTIGAVPCNLIVVATPVDLARVIDLPMAYCRVRYDLEEMSRPDLAEVVSRFLQRQRERAPRAVQSSTNGSRYKVRSALRRS